MTKNTPVFNTSLLSNTSDGGVIWEARRPRHTFLTRVIEEPTNSYKIIIDRGDIELPQLRGSWAGQKALWSRLETDALGLAEYFAMEAYVVE